MNAQWLSDFSSIIDELEAEFQKKGDNSNSRWDKEYNEMYKDFCRMLSHIMILCHYRQSRVEREFINFKDSKKKEISNGEEVA